MTLPNLLTWLRIALIPVFIALFYLPDGWLSAHARNLAAAWLFIVGALTDWLDGWLARTLDQTSAFGAFLDPVADKLMVAAALIVLVALGRADVTVAVVIIGREIAISALREWMAKIGASRSVAVSFVGKLKTGFQMTAITMLLWWDTPIEGLPLRAIGTALMWLAVVLTLWSMAFYLRRAWPLVAAAEQASKAGNGR
jgi:CDP-diacylglycerol--glycerol-3-phosphate 3-phosphatidyltransferase/cardiolipin synthase